MKFHEEPDSIVGGWPDETECAGAGLNVHEDVLSREPWPHVHIALVPRAIGPRFRPICE